MRGFWVGCVFGAGLFVFALPGNAQTQTPAPPAPAATPTAPPAAAPTAPSSPSPTSPKPAPPSAPGAPPPGPPPGLKLAPGPNEPDQGVPGLPSDATTVTLDVPARPVAQLTATATWDEAFKVIKDTQERLKAAVDKTGLKIAGHAVSVFTQEDSKGFTFTAMLPLDPGAKVTPGDGVTLGQSPAGKAIKFQHRGAYDDIDSTYDLITAYLDEKNLEAKDFFVEEYLTPLTSGEDPYLAVDIYVFLKP
jgi:effector-binding domain-containing protein